MYIAKQAGVVVLLLAATMSVRPVFGQAPVKIGQASISSAPPTFKAKTETNGSGFNATMMLSRKIYADELPDRQEGHLEEPGRPIPTNDWWTDIINNRYSGSLWSYPAMLRTSENGVENINKILRDYFPKGTDFRLVDQAEMNKIQYQINNRPRKKLDFSTPKIEFFKRIT